MTTVLLRDYSRAAAAPGEIAALASVIVNCPKLKKFDAAGCEEMSGEELSRTIAGEGPLTMFLYTFRASRDPKHSKLHSFNCLAGCFNGGVVRLISDIRLKHGHNAVNLDRCGKFVLSDDLSDIADMTHIDLSGINSLEGTCRASLLGQLEPRTPRRRFRNT